MEYTLKHSGFAHVWKNNIRQKISTTRYSIYCTTHEQLEFCIAQLRKIEPKAPVVGNVLEMPVLVRWIGDGTLSEIMMDRGPADNMGKVMNFEDVFTVRSFDIPSTTAQPSLFPLSGKEEGTIIQIQGSEMSIIHSKINYHVIQAKA